MKKYLLFLLLLPVVVNAQSGCCSHHGGVAGCSSDGRQICIDGTLSPSCTCTPTVTSTKIRTTVTTTTAAKIYGCTDRTATNYNKNADIDDSSCIYSTTTEITTTSNSTSSDNESSGDGVIGAISLGLLGWGGYKIAQKRKKNK